MATPNRSALINRTIKVLRKHFKPVPPPKDRTLFEHLLFACLVEDSPQESAEQVFNSLKQDYFGWNEVRVSTIRELTDVLKPLVNPPESAARLKQSLHAVFESVYEFDIETLKKQNIGQAVKQLQKYNGTTPFAVAYVTQHALGGHSIPLNKGTLIALHAVGVISDEEYTKGVVPGLERTVPKSKGAEIGSLLHQFGVEIGRNPYGPNARKLMLEIDPNCKDRLPKRLTRRPEADGAAQPASSIEPARPAAAGAGRKQAAGKELPKEKEKDRKKAPAEKAEKSDKPPTKRPATAKRPAPPAKKTTKKGTKKPTTRKLAKRKPR
jgi:endonuclease-3